MVGKVGCYLDSIRITLCSKKYTNFDNINTKNLVSYLFYLITAQLYIRWLHVQNGITQSPLLSSTETCGPYDKAYLL